jgi:Domain of unknown function (DUF4180)
MEIKTHQIKNEHISEVISDKIIIATIEDGLDLLGNLYYQGVDKIIIYEKNIIPEFFNLSTGFAGELLQKFSNYRVRLAIVGEFSKYQSKSFKDFMHESNKLDQVQFVENVSEVLV